MPRKPRAAKPKSQRSIKITGIRRKEIDVDLLAHVYFLQGQRMVRERREQEEARLEKEQVRMDFAAPSPAHAAAPPTQLEPSPQEVARLRRQLEATREQLCQMGINPDDGSLQPPAGALSDQ